MKSVFNFLKKRFVLAGTVDVSAVNKGNKEKAGDPLDECQEFLSRFNIYTPNTLPSLQYLRQFGSVHFMPLCNAWLILDYADMVCVFQDESILTNYEEATKGDNLLGASGDVHEATRKLVMPLFDQACLLMLRNITEVSSNNLIDQLLKQPSFDLVADFSQPLIEEMFVAFFGFKNNDYNRLHDILKEIDTDDGRNLFNRLNSFFDSCIEAPIYGESDGIIKRMIEWIADEKIEKEQALSLLRLFWLASYETTQVLFTILFQAVLTHPAIASNIAGDSHAISRFFEECLRLSSTSRVQRITTQAIIIGGVQLPAGSRLIFNMQSANNDPLVFESPAVFSIDRPFQKKLSFGTGMHICIGMGLARTVGVKLLQVLIGRLHEFDGFEAAPPVYGHANFIDTITSVEVSKKL